MLWILLLQYISLLSPFPKVKGLDFLVKSAGVQFLSRQILLNHPVESVRKIKTDLCK